MKKRLIILSIFASLFINISFGQKGIIKSAQKKYDKLSYVKTTEQLLELAQNGTNSVDVLQNLANAYYFNGKMEDASKWYEKLIDLNQEIDTETYFRYAQSLKALKNYTKADKVMLNFSELNPKDSRAKLFKSNQGYLNTIEKASDDFELKNLDANTSFSDFGTSTNGNHLIVASARQKGSKLYNWNGQPFLDIFQLNADGSVQELNGIINTKYHESSTTFTNDGTTMYFTRNNFFKRKFNKDSSNTHGLKIYKATLIDGTWSNLVSLPFNSDNYNVAHPSLNSDNTKLYFASDMPGTMGASDIYVVSINEDGTYGEPKNLGTKINTEGRENFPYISKEGTLYFSSDSHVGLGGLDVFEVDSNNESVRNLGKPINSSKDDFGFIINESTRQGYISSNREGGKGDDDIYSFIRNVCVQQISGTVVDKDTNEIIVNADVKIYDNNQNIIQTLKSDANGEFSFELTCEDNSYKAISKKETYEKDSQDFVVYSKDNKETIALKLSLKPEPKAAAVGTDLFKLLNLNPIYFDYDQSLIRADAESELTKIIAYLKEFTNVEIDVRSHTDSRGRDAYNLSLSNRRNQSTIQYIVKSGISTTRITGKGYGETQLANKCTNGVKCSKEEHQQNRRSEFIVIAN